MTQSEDLHWRPLITPPQFTPLVAHEQGVSMRRVERRAIEHADRKFLPGIEAQSFTSPSEVSQVDRLAHGLERLGGAKPAGRFCSPSTSSRFARSA